MDETERLKLEKQEAEQREAATNRHDPREPRQGRGWRVQAMALGVKPDRIEHVLRLAELAEIEVTDGVVSAEAVKQVVSAVLVDIPEL